MIRFVLQLFTWWNGQTLAGRIWTRLTGARAGQDKAGNIYYCDRHDRRWVVYRGVAEASKIPPLWHAWLHHMQDVPPGPDDEPEKWMPNMTGTALATRPPGSLTGEGQRKPATGDYQAWHPPASNKKKGNAAHAQQSS